LNQFAIEGVPDRIVLIDNTHDLNSNSDAAEEMHDGPWALHNGERHLKQVALPGRPGF